MGHRDDVASAVAERALADLQRDAHSLDVALHSVEVTVGREPVLRAGCAPAGPDAPHRMYSVSKTVTGLAVGLLAAEGALDLDDPVLKHFGDMAPVHPWLEATTLHHMLSMRGPHRSTTFKRVPGGWLESYFRVPPSHAPGTVFTYDTSASYTLAALVERVTGTTVADYLRPRVLDPIGVSAGLRFLPSPEGVSHGGSGLVCSPHDLLLLAQLMLDGGVHEGRSLLPADYLERATTPQASTSLLTWGSSLRHAYGYQLWLPPQGGWAMFGLGGQIVYGDPARDLAVVVTADTQACTGGDQRLIDLVLGGLLPALTGATPSAVPDTAHANPSATAAPARTELAWPAPSHDPAHAVAASGRWVRPTGGVGNDEGPAEIVLELGDGGGRLRSSDGWDLPLRFGEPAPARLDGDPAVVTAGWSSPSTLDVRVAGLGDELATVRVRCVRAEDGSLTVQSQGFAETIGPGWTFHGTYSAAA
ncbi:beta-lactamase family protein [Isoptericola sp. NEAU-Y5]|uniref:Beta-lactamase family protein n=1 Tax=Isoptericola luteus TaxID=2879484 RepID=A0ABS7ZD51_9MICO|nr:serine hydrolase domain-containing protein [Isoptericola sp. NEAU-Y5]MCA5892964.1 beta-lactamase family protein [Isoptericola sp. NEAU-Y5]